jgi:hypothetical protein
MSFAEHLFPASELQALKHYSYPSEPSTKRRRLNSSDRSPSIASTATDSGYYSEEAPSPKTLAESPAQATTLRTDTVRRDCPARPSSGAKLRRINSEPLPSTTRLRPDLIQKYLSRMHPTDRRRYTASRPAPPIAYHTGSPSQSEYTDRDLKADSEILSAQHAIEMARQRLHSHSTPIQPSTHDATDLGWTAGPNAASSANIFTRLFDGCRINSNERNMLNSIASTSEPKPVPVAKPEPELSAKDKHEVEAQVSFAGLAMPVCLDEDELEYEPWTYHNETDIGFEYFFNLDAASMPSEYASRQGGQPLASGVLPLGYVQN